MWQHAWNMLATLSVAAAVAVGAPTPPCDLLLADYRDCCDSFGHAACASLRTPTLLACTPSPLRPVDRRRDRRFATR